MESSHKLNAVIGRKEIQVSQAKTAVRRIIDGTQTFWHDRFKSDTKKLIKCIFDRDVKATGGQVPEDIKEFDHQHMFHSHDSNGRPQTTCVAVGGHYHHIQTHDDQGNQLVDKDGRPRVICGPAMQKVKIKQGKRMVSVEREIKYQMQNGELIKDNHKHEFKYDRSQELSPDKIQQLKKQNGQAMRAAFEGQPQIEDKTPAPLNKQDGVEIK